MGDSKNMSDYGRKKSFDDFNTLSDDEKLKHYLSLNDKQRQQLIPSDYDHGVVEVKPQLDSPSSQKFLKLYKKQNMISDNRIPSSEKEEQDNFLESQNLNNFHNTIRADKLNFMKSQSFNDEINSQRFLHDLNRVRQDPDIDNEQRSVLINARLNALRKLGKNVDADQETGEFFFDE